MSKKKQRKAAEEKATNEEARFRVEEAARKRLEETAARKAVEDAERLRLEEETTTEAKEAGRLSIEAGEEQEQEAQDAKYSRRKEQRRVRAWWRWSPLDWRWNPPDWNPPWDVA